MITIFESWKDVQQRNIVFLKLTNTIRDFCDGSITVRKGEKTGLRYLNITRGNSDIMFYRFGGNVEIRLYDEPSNFHALEMILKTSKFTHTQYDEPNDREMIVFYCDYNNIDNLIDEIKEKYPKYQIEEINIGREKRFDL